MTEHRTIKRFDLELQMLIEGVDIRGNLFEEATKSLNISSRGVYFLLNNQVRKENRLQAIISLPNKTRGRVKLKGKVLRVENASNEEGRKQGIALEFN